MAVTATENLRALGIFNAWNLMQKAHEAGVKPVVFITYRAGGKWEQSAWQVVSLGKTDPDAHYMDRGHKTFPVWGRGERLKVLDEACKWTDARYGTQGWRTIAGLGGAVFPESLIQFLKQLLKSRKDSDHA